MGLRLRFEIFLLRERMMKKIMMFTTKPKHFQRFFIVGVMAIYFFCTTFIAWFFNYVPPLYMVTKFLSCSNFMSVFFPSCFSIFSPIGSPLFDILILPIKRLLNRFSTMSIIMGLASRFQISEILPAVFFHV